jgi:hypothetical protein
MRTPHLATQEAHHVPSRPCAESNKQKGKIQQQKEVKQTKTAGSVGLSLAFFKKSANRQNTVCCE